MSLHMLFLWITPLFWDIFKAIGDAIMGGIQWFWEHVILNIVTLGGYESVLSLRQMYVPTIIELPSSYGPSYFITQPFLNLFDYVRNAGLGFFAIVFMVAGICYLFENFRMIREGTAFNILTNAMFTLVLMYLFLPLYDTVAYGINIFNLSLLKPNYGFGPGGTFTNPVDYLCDGLVGYANPIATVLMMATALTILFLGFARMILIYSLVVMMPILLVLRLIPLTSRIADDLIHALIGIIIASTLTALIIMTGALLKTHLAMTDAASMVFSSAVLFAGAFMPTILAPRLGTLFTSSTIAASAAATTAQRFTTQQLTGAFMGAVGGVAAGFAGGAAQGAAGAGQLSAGGAIGRASLMVGAGLKGAARGMITGGAAGAGKGLGGVSAGARAGIAAGEESGLGVARARTEDSLDLLMDHFASDVSILGNDAVGTQFMNSLRSKPLVEVGAQFADTLGVEKIIDTPQEQARFGSNMMKRLGRYTPTQISRISQGLDKWKGLSHKERTKLMQTIKAQRKTRPEIMMEAKPPAPEVKLETVPSVKPPAEKPAPPTPKRVKKEREFIARGHGGEINKQIEEWFKKQYGEGFTGKKKEKRRR